MSKIQFTAKTRETALEIAKAIRSVDPVAAKAYMDGFLRRRKIELEAMKENA